MSDSGLIQALQISMEAHTSEINTTQPGKVVSYDPATNRAVVTPSQPKLLADGSPLEAPNVVEVPVVWPVGMAGKVGMTWPLQAGDGVKLDFAQRSLDGWLNGQEAAPDDPRRFDLADAVATPGLSATGVAPNPNDVELFFGPVKLRLRPDGSAVLFTNGGSLTISANGEAAFNGPTVHVSGDLVAVGDIWAGPVSLRHHQHLASGGNGVGGPPVGG